MIMNIIWMIVLGLIVGVIAKLIVPGTGHIGWIATALLGIAGGWVGGTLGSIVFAPHRLEITPPIKHSFLGALVGAVILLWGYRSMARRG
ncbi:MAG: GlsB/YeaQ/YmgE family stress response membrane protein [Mycobacterium sp.]|nr:GlsB/YeaQ/YmgE family stress response membrane protein [Mycobacterium sp.]